MNSFFDEIFNCYPNVEDETTYTIESKKIINSVLDDIKIDSETGRLILPALWRENVAHLLSNNFNLAKSILLTHKKRLSHSKLLEYDAVIKDQLDNGVIVPVCNDRNNPKLSYIAHSAVFRENVSSTKVRVVYLSNLSAGRDTLSHNQISIPGANLNHKLQIATLLLRFDKFMVTFDLKKAFLQLLIRKEDSNKLLFLWFKNVAEKDFTIVTYRICRVPFGMRYSPFLLMIALYYILVHTVTHDDEFVRGIKLALYDLAYVDNLAYTSDNETDLLAAIDIAKETLGKYRFDLQQYSSNSECTRSKINECGDECEITTKLFGMKWDTISDTISCNKLFLDINANTKRMVLSTIQSNFDPFGMCIPLLNRAKIFIHELQCKSDLKWDDKLDREQMKEWNLISKQINKCSVIHIPRSVGSRSDNYNLVIYCDASKDFVGCAVYLKVIGCDKVNLIFSRNSLVTKNLKTKSIPVLELVALDLGVTTAVDLYNRLTSAVRPINITNVYAFTDSMIVLSWIKSKAVDFGKVDRKQVFINNKLDNIISNCDKVKITFDHVSGTTNPADAVSRTVSESMLYKTTFLSGPKFVVSEDSFVVPFCEPIKVFTCTAVTNNELECIVNLDKYSSFNKLVRIVSLCFKFIYKLRNSLGNESNDDNIASKSTAYIIRMAQINSFSKVISSLKSGKYDEPIITQMNLFISDDGLVRVQSKLKKLNSDYGQKCPILLHKSCPIAKAIIFDFHTKLGHSGVYKTLSVIRKEFWITNSYVTVRKIIRECITCKRLNNRTVKLSQSSYKDYRVNPESIPFRNIFLDHCGPFQVRDAKGDKIKVYILVITCLWSRAVNLIFSRLLDKDTFVKALQMHIFEYGVPSIIISDNGSQIVAGIEQTISFLSDSTTRDFLDSHNIKCISFTPYPAGASHLGAIVESLVKQVKRIISSSLKNNIITVGDFQFFILETKMLINKRPLTFKNVIGGGELNEDTLTPLTPELIIKGYDVPCCGIIPQTFHNLDDWENGDDFLSGDSRKVIENYNKLTKIRNNLHKLYRDEFITNLFTQATDRPGRYSRVNHTKLCKGDVVTIKTPLKKPIDYPFALVIDTEVNDLDEVVTAIVRKSNGEIVRRHAEDLIFITKSTMTFNDSLDDSTGGKISPVETIKPDKRSAAKKCEQLNRELLNCSL